jgi:hypothetical protein
MKDNNSTAVARRTSGGVVTKAYLENQAELLKLFGMKGVYSLENFEVVVSDDGRKTLRKREKPLKIIDNGDDGVVAVVMSRTLGERMFGREREEDKLEILNPAHNLEAKELL